MEVTMAESVNAKWNELSMLDDERIQQDSMMRAMRGETPLPTFHYADAPERYVRKFTEAWLDREAAVHPMDGGPEGRPVILDYSGFPEAVEQYLGKEVAQRVRRRLDAMRRPAHDGQNRV
jgi:hypothetical protein